MACCSINIGKITRSINSSNYVRNYTQHYKTSVAEQATKINIQDQVQVAEYGSRHDGHAGKSCCGKGGKRGSMCSRCYKKHKYGQQKQTRTERSYGQSYGSCNPNNGSNY